MKKLSKAAVLAAVSLAACQPQSLSNVAVDDDAGSPTNAALAPADQAAAEAGKTGVSPPPPKVAIDLPTVPLPTHIPESFRGRWGLTSIDCTTTRGDAKGLLTVSDSKLTFYESRGTLNKILGATVLSFDGRYGFSGEGQTWLRTERFKLIGDQLHRTTDAEPGQEPPVNLTYARCPG